MSEHLYPRWNPVFQESESVTWEELTEQEKRAYAKSSNFSAPGGFSAEEEERMRQTSERLFGSNTKGEPSQSIFDEEPGEGTTFRFGSSLDRLRLDSEQLCSPKTREPSVASCPPTTTPLRATKTETTKRRRRKSMFRTETTTTETEHKHERELTTQEKAAKLAAEIETDFCLDGDLPTTLRSTCIETTDNRGVRRLEVTIVVEHAPENT